MGTTRLKVRRRDVALDGRRFTALSLRPSSTRQRFATNHYHGTWHVLGGPGAGQLLGRICWAMAHERHDRTVFVIDPAFLVPNPFDADRSNPIVIVNSDRGTPSRAGFDRLRSALPWSGPSEGTVTLDVRSLPAVIDDADLLVDLDRRSGAAWNDHRRRSWTDEVNGLLVFSAPADVLRWWGRYLSRLGESWYAGSDDTELGYPDGEAQVFRDFSGMVGRAIEARARCHPGREHERLEEGERPSVWFEPRRVAAAERRCRPNETAAPPR